MRTPWSSYAAVVLAAAAIAVSPTTTEGVDLQRTPPVSADGGATTQANAFPKNAPATWNQDEEKSGALEGELRLLEQADPTDPYDPLEELDDTDQQRDRPSDDDEDDIGIDVTVTTLVPTATTEEDTRVDEPTDRGPAEPTKENGSGVTVTMVIEQSAPSATLSPDVWSSLDDGNQPSNTTSPRTKKKKQKTEEKTETGDSSMAAAAATDNAHQQEQDDDEDAEEEEEEVGEAEDVEKSQSSHDEEEAEEELEAIKRQMKEEDDLIPIAEHDVLTTTTSTTIDSANEQANQEIGDELDQLDESNEDAVIDGGDIGNEKDKSDEKKHEKNGGGAEEEEESQFLPEVTSSAPSTSSISPIDQQLPKEMEQEKELLSRSTRRAQEAPQSSASQFPAKVNEDVLELMVRLSEKPRSWARISSLLGKLDYESASQLKSALQIQALKDNQASEESTKHNKNMKHIITAAKLASLAPEESRESHNSALGKNHHSNHRLSAYDHHPNERPKIPGKHDKLFKNNNKLGLKQLTTSNGRHHGKMYHSPPPPNTIHVQWEKSRRPPVSANTLPTHANTRLQYLAQQVAGAQTASSWYNPNHSNTHLGSNRNVAKMPNSGSGKSLIVPQYHQNSGANKDAGVNNNKARPLGYPYTGPISTLAVDVPGQGMLNKNKYPGGEKNNQAFIAVSVYKPKDSYRQVDLSPKANRLPHRYPSSLRPKGAGNSNFAMEKPVTVDGSPAFDVVPSNSGHKGFKNKNHKGKGRNKGAKAKQKGKNGMQGKTHHARKLKYNNKMATDEIEAQLLALSKMERKLKQHLMQKEKLRQRIRMKHDQHHHNVRSAREVASFM